MITIKIVYLLLFIIISSSVSIEDIITLYSNNTILLNKDIDELHISKIIYQFTINQDKYETLYLYINSPGGDVKSGNDLIDTIQYYKHKINIICIADYAASMAFAIFQSCPIRYGLLHSVFMQHSITSNINKMSLSEMSNYVEYINHLQLEFNELQADRIGWSLQDFTNKVKNDWWMTGKQALKEKILDKLVIVGCSVELSSSIETNIEYDIKDKKIYKYTYSKCPLITKEIEKIEINLES